MSEETRPIHYTEVVTPDPAAVIDHYTKVCGWNFSPETPELGMARVVGFPDGSSFGVRAPMHEQEKSVTRTYVRVDDIEGAVERAAASGAEVALPPMEIPGRGQVAIYFIGGIEQGLWQV